MTDEVPRPHGCLRFPLVPVHIDWDRGLLDTLTGWWISVVQEFGVGQYSSKFQGWENVCIPRFAWVMLLVHRKWLLDDPAMIVLTSSKNFFFGYIQQWCQSTRHKVLTWSNQRVGEAGVVVSDSLGRKSEPAISHCLSIKGCTLSQKHRRRGPLEYGSRTLDQCMKAAT